LDRVVEEKNKGDDDLFGGEGGMPKLDP